MNIFACLVHESRECVIDLVRNLHHLDPDSRILLYNGGCDTTLLQSFPFERYNAIVHPSARPMKWGWLHDFALDCFRFALEHHPFDTMTIVDSDQLGLRPGYSAFLGEFLSQNPGAGLLGNVQTPNDPGPLAAPALHARKELELWRPFLRKFPDGESKFVHWTFWPSTVFSADAARDLVTLWDTDSQLRDLLQRSRIWATEEVLFPTLVALLGHRVLTSPCHYDVVRYRVRYTVPQLEAAMARRDSFWAHPVPRRYDDPLRTHVRARFHEYAAPGNPVAAQAPQGATPAPGPLPRSEDTPRPRLLLTWPILSEMRKVEGWLSDEEADLLIASASHALGALPAPHAVVEVGSFCGKATLVLARVAEALGTSAPIHAIDPGDGVVGARDRNLQQLSPTRHKLQRTLLLAGLEPRVKVHFQQAPQVPWSEPIGFLLIDGLHDYGSVAADFHHLEPWLAVGGLVAFHDCADYFPGVKRFVQELLHAGRFRRLHASGSLVVLEKRAAAERTEAVPGQPRIEVATAGPLVSCLMPTHNRRPFIPLALRWFLAQDWPSRELVIVDDGSDPVSDLLPDDARIRYLRLERKHSLGAKRNLACQSAKGDILVHWDDDDWSAPHRLTYQVSSLLQEGADVCGLTRLYYHQPATGRSWQYQYPDGQRPWVAGNTLCYTRDFWRGNPFPDINVGEDARFLWNAPSRRLLSLADSTFFVAFIHSTNVDLKRVHHAWWHPHPTEALRTLMGEAFDTYAQLLTSEAPLLPHAQAIGTRS
ncbi:glycosyltransferase [Archangium violaceum]|uniref:glycosyltransferase n=1 Tax=Archangium violaceum TaxID=83451 RepID=UPI00193B58C7|nr:glycosyltransferase [Archangium violaceum]QRK06071.1 glycosyltransferase [Archangium violaceum]